jgi:hypothetical protein
MEEERKGIGRGYNQDSVYVCACTCMATGKSKRVLRMNQIRKDCQLKANPNKNAKRK